MSNTSVGQVWEEPDMCGRDVPWLYLVLGREDVSQRWRLLILAGPESFVGHTTSASDNWFDSLETCRIA